MNKRIKKKKIYGTMHKYRYKWVATFIACNDIAEGYSKLAYHRYVRYKNISESSRIKYTKRLLHDLMVKRPMKFLTIRQARHKTHSVKQRSQKDPNRSTNAYF